MNDYMHIAQNEWYIKGHFFSFLVTISCLHVFFPVSDRMFLSLSGKFEKESSGTVLCGLLNDKYWTEIAPLGSFSSPFSLMRLYEVRQVAGLSVVLGNVAGNDIYSIVTVTLNFSNRSK